MLIESLILITALAGTAIGGYIDLKTTEIPDAVPISMTIAGLILHIAAWIQTGNPATLTSAITIAILYLIIGYILYYTGQWGEADVLLLAAVGFLIPGPLSIFNLNPIASIYPLLFLLTTFLVGGIYSLAYSFALTLKKPEVYTKYYADIKENKKKIAKLFILVLAGFTIFNIILQIALTSSITTKLILAQIYLFAPMTLALVLLYRFAKILDTTAFKRTIPIEKVREGDVLAQDITFEDKTTLSGKLFIGLTEEQIRKIKENNIKQIEIKEGIRYAPTFFLSILFIWFFGKYIYLIF